MPDNTKVNMNISDNHRPAFMQMSRRFCLISRDKKSVFNSLSLTT